MTFESLPENRHQEIVEFLAGVFGTSPDAPFINPKLRHWKYYAAHPFWNENRSYVFRDAEGLLAHCGVIPAQYAVGGEVKTTFQGIDWAGSKRRAGAGLMLFQRLWKLADSNLCIGGSDDAQRVVSRIRTLRRAAPLVYCAYPIRPWGQLSRSPRSWKSALKWGRSWRWRLARKQRDLRRWKAVPMDRLTAEHAPLLVPNQSDEYYPLRRTPELVNYWLACPAGRMRTWQLEYDGVPVGVLILGFFGAQARIVDLVVKAGAVSLAEAYSVAIDLASRETGVCELAGASSVAANVQAMVDAGMLCRRKLDVFFGDVSKSFRPEVPIEINLTIGDGFFFVDETTSFLTF